YFRRVACGPDDVLLFFYTGHGATVEGRGHVLTTSHGNVDRAVVRSEMQARRARLCILLTDCCSTVVRLRPRGPMPAGPAPGESRVSPLARCLLLQHNGTVDLTSSSYGEASWSDTERGGLFTHALSLALASPSIELFDKDNDGFVTWSEFFDEVRIAT